MIRKLDGCKSNLEKSSTTKAGEHIPCGYSMSTTWTLDGIENKHDVYRGEYYMKVLWILKTAGREDSKLWKEKNDASSKRRIWVIS